MDFIIGCLVTVATIFVANRMISNMDKTAKIPVPQYTQSRSFSIVLSKFQHIINKQDEQLETQAFKHNEKQTVRVVIHNNVAYWMQNNKFLTADVIDGMIDQDTTKPVDTMSMSQIELDNISFIVEKLTEGQNHDRGNSGDTKL